ncbi:MAG: adenine phosphoribosyltransferase [Candidatus Gastranaerophilales bacterium]|nr:adenine phosphoribosyltransferase [Candidatus Gastranaerophilales bacterium]
MPELVKTKIRDIPNFPKDGIIFKDITTAIKDAETFRRIINFLTEQFKNDNIDYVAGIESRGFIFGAPLAYNLNTGLVIIRKPGKLPAKVKRVSYELEYGTDTVEIHEDAIEEGKRILLIDDLLATGGTAAASCALVEKTGGILAGIAFVVELEFLNGREKLPQNAKIVSMVNY